MRQGCLFVPIVVFAAFAAHAGDIEVAGGMTMVGQWIVSGDDAVLPDGRVGELSTSFDLEVDAELAPGVKGYLHAEASAGDGIDAHVPAFNTANADAGGTGPADVSEAWLEGNLGAAATLSVGKVDVSAVFDTNEVANDEMTQFLNGSFRNSTAGFFPADNAAAIWLTYAPQEGPVEVVLGWAETDADWEFVFEDPYWFGEISIRLGPGGERGRVRVYAWSASGAETSLAGVVDSTSGGGLSADSEVADGLNMFARYGLREESDFDVASAFSLGAEFSGGTWMNEGDAIAVAFGMNLLSDDYKAATPGAVDESVFEAYYRLEPSERFALTPSVQVVWNAGGVDSDAVVLLGLRAQANF